MRSLLEIAKNHWSRFAVWSTAIALIGVAALPFVVPQSRIDQDIPENWKNGVAALGLNPIYPPEEDFYVGDIWAIVDQGCKFKSCASGFHKSAIRLTHIDLSAGVLSGNDLPVFADTPFGQKDDRYLYQNTDPIGSVPPDHKYRLTLVAFPAVTLANLKESNASVGFLDYFLKTNGDLNTSEKVSIPTVETYGVQYQYALDRLNEFCGAKTSAKYCSDGYVRAILAYTLGPLVMDGDEQKHCKYRISLQLISRVYLSREFDISYEQENRLGASATRGSRSSAPDVTPEKNKSTSADGNAVNIPANEIEDKGNAAGASGQAFLSGSSAEKLTNLYQRPLAFGYRAVTVELTPGNVCQSPG
jgi:hypothetical protein